MTLQEWQDQTEVHVGEFKPGRPDRVVSDSITGMKRTWLFHLEDYRVTSVANGSILLAPKQGYTDPH